MVLLLYIFKKTLRRFRRLLFSFIILLATCPLWGQGNKIDPIGQIGFEGNLEVHLKDNQIIFGMDACLFGKQMLFTVHDKEYKHVVWKRYKDQVLLEAPRVQSLSKTIIPQNQDPDINHEILGVFPVMDSATSRTVYIDVSELFLNSSLARPSSIGTTVMVIKTYVENAKFLDNEMIVKVRRLLAKGKTQYFDTVHFSLFLLPKPMISREFDHRMGFFAEDENSFINHFPRHAKACIARWRLEKPNSNKVISKPIQPITFYFGKEVPEKWKPYIRAGIMEWAPAFEAAGFLDALQVRELAEEDGGWLAHSLHYSLIRFPYKEDVRHFSSNHGSTVKKVTDLRSGEILKADILIGSSYEDIMDNYFVRCAPMDPRAWQYPFPNDLMGELIQSIVAHETGHALGIKDANFGEYTYPFDKMRDKDWLEAMGHTPSIMGYARQNNIVQPEDSIPPYLLIPKVGPTDIYQIQWGYGNMEKNSLEDLVRLQDSVPWYRYNLNLFEVLGPGSGNEVVDNDDPVASAELGLRNIKKVIELLPMVTQNEKDNALLERLYDKSLRFWNQEMEQVLTLVGGYTIQYKSGRQQGPVYNPIPRKQQIKALEFLIRNAFKAPSWLSHPEYSQRIRYSSGDETLLKYQIKLLKRVSSLLRLGRIEQMERSGKPYNGLLKSIVSTLREGMFKDFDKIQSLDFRTLDLQRAYISTLLEGVEQHKYNLESNNSNNESPYSSYIQSVFLSELKILKLNLERGLKSMENEIVRTHMQYCLELLESVP